jgi:hypothetical protein
MGPHLMPKFADIANLEEDRRIELIAHRVKDHRDTVAFIVEDDVKAKRYVDKLTALLPAVKVMWRGNGPLGTIIVKVGIVQ